MSLNIGKNGRLFDPEFDATRKEISQAKKSAVRSNLFAKGMRLYTNLGITAVCGTIAFFCAREVFFNESLSDESRKLAGGIGIASLVAIPLAYSIIRDDKNSTEQKIRDYREQHYRELDQEITQRAKSDIPQLPRDYKNCLRF